MGLRGIVSLTVNICPIAECSSASDWYGTDERGERSGTGQESLKPQSPLRRGADPHVARVWRHSKSHVGSLQREGTGTGPSEVPNVQHFIPRQEHVCATLQRNVYDLEKSVHITNLSLFKDIALKSRWAPTCSQIPFQKHRWGVRKGSGVSPIGSTRGSLSWKRKTSLSLKPPMSVFLESCRQSGATDAAIASDSLSGFWQQAVTDRLSDCAWCRFLAGAGIVSCFLPDEITVSEFRWKAFCALVLVGTKAWIFKGPRMCCELLLLLLMISHRPPSLDLSRRDC